MTTAAKNVASAAVTCFVVLAAGSVREIFGGSDSALAMAQDEACFLVEEGFKAVSVKRVHGARAVALLNVAAEIDFNSQDEAQSTGGLWERAQKIYAGNL